MQQHFVDPPAPLCQLTFVGIKVLEGSFFLLPGAYREKGDYTEATQVIPTKSGDPQLPHAVQLKVNGNKSILGRNQLSHITFLPR